MKQQITRLILQIVAIVAFAAIGYFILLWRVQ
jgi:uncharacterized protein YneF (UPF0154 family)